MEIILNKIIAASKEDALARSKGDYKSANKNYDLVHNAVTELRQLDKIDELKSLLTYEDPAVRIVAASYLLNTFPNEAIVALKQIILASIPLLSFSATLVLSEWEKGNLNL